MSAPPAPLLLARGPWEPAELEVLWRADEFEAGAAAGAAADRMLEALRQRGSPSHDGLTARMVSFDVRDHGLRLELQPVRWALRLLPDAGHSSISVMCVVRDQDGRWLAGRRSAWVATWAGRWELGAAGAIEVDEHPALALARELSEEWSLAAQRAELQALMRLENGQVVLVAEARVASGASIDPGDEHDAHAWWPAAIEDWPPEAEEPLRALGEMLIAG